MKGDSDFDGVGDILREAADTLICPRFRCLDAAAIATKSHADDLVTIADLETEEFLSRHLTALLPGSLAVGEESVFRDPARKACLDSDKPVWVIDPVDGTANFVHGLPGFAIIIALVERRRTIRGWIYDPLSRRLYKTEAGAGVWCEGRRLCLDGRQGRELTAMSGCLGRRMIEHHRQHLGELSQRGSAAHDYMALCDGRLDFRLFRLLNPWDHAAGVLMVEEAGGYVRLLSDKSYAPLFHGADGLLIAPDADTWLELRQVLEI